MPSGTVAATAGGPVRSGIAARRTPDEPGCGVVDVAHDRVGRIRADQEQDDRHHDQEGDQSCDGTN
jgi:hypothetical protein